MLWRKRKSICLDCSPGRDDTKRASGIDDSVRIVLTGRKNVAEFRRAILSAMSHPKVEIEVRIAEEGRNRTTHSGKRIGQGSKSIELEGSEPRQPGTVKGAQMAHRVRSWT